MEHLKREHREAIAAAKRVLDEAERNGRLVDGDLNAADLAKWQRYIDRAKELRREIDNPNQPIVGHMAFAGLDQNGRETRSEPADEWSRIALGPEQSVYEQRRAAGWERPGQERYESLRLGQFLRALVTGPKSDLERRALSEGSDSAGGYTVPEPLSADFIDRLRNTLVITRAGARMIPLISDQQTVAKLETDAGGSWLSEASTGATTDPTFGAHVFAPRTYRGIVTASRELLQDSVNIEQILERSFVQGFAREIDRVCLVGESTAGEPQGLYSSTGVPTYSVGSSSAGGAASLLNYSPILSGYQTLMENNCDVSRTISAIMAPRSFVELGKLQDSQNQPMQRPPALDNVRFMPTASVPVTLTDGTTGTGTAIFMGDFRDFMIGSRLDLSVEVLRERYASNYQYGYLFHARQDVGWAHDASFCNLRFIGPSTAV
jgi:HK97 family phage major capsid protein